MSTKSLTLNRINSYYFSYCPLVIGKVIGKAKESHLDSRVQYRHLGSSSACWSLAMKLALFGPPCSLFQCPSWL